LTIPIDSKEPNTGRIQKEDGSLVNVADLTGGNEVIFQNAATTLGNGSVFTVGGYKTLTVEIDGSDTNTARTVNFYRKSRKGELKSIFGVRTSDGAVATSTTGIGEEWQFDISGKYQIVIDLGSITGGSVTVKGGVVA